MAGTPVRHILGRGGDEDGAGTRDVGRGAGIWDVTRCVIRDVVGRAGHTWSVRKV